MNNYGVVLNEIGFGDFFDGVLKYLKPLLIPLYGKLAESLETHHSFIVCTQQQTENATADLPFCRFSTNAQRTLT
jgi:hypothetical protein